MTLRARFALTLTVMACRGQAIPEVVFRCEPGGGCPSEEQVCWSDGWCRPPAAVSVVEVGLAPTQLTVPCEGWWRWKTDITVDDRGGVAEWKDQCPAGRHFTQPQPALRPRFDEGGGAVRPDGVDDFLRNTNPPNDTEAEFTFVVEQPATPYGVFFSAENVTAPDADALSFSMGSTGAVARYVVIAASRLMQTAAPLIAPGSVAIVSVTNERIFINGDEATYSERTYHVYSGAARRRMEMFGATRNAVGGDFAPPVAKSNVALREVMWHARQLPPEDRAALVARIRWQQGW